MTDISPPYLPSLGRLLGFASDHCTALSMRKLEPHGLKLVHWVLLTALWRNDGMTTGELAGYYRSSNMVLTRVLGQMENNGLITRSTDPDDRRIVRIFLTEKARQLSHLVDFYQEINQMLLMGFTPQEQNTFINLLERVIINTRNSSGQESEKK